MYEFHASEHISHSRFLAAGTPYVACNAGLSVIKANENSVHYFFNRKCLKKPYYYVTKHSAVSDLPSGIHKAVEFERLHCIVRICDRKQVTYFLMV